MATHITQIDDVQNQRTVLRIDGEMHRDDAEVLEKIAGQIRSDSNTTIVIDLAELDLMDSDAAPILRRLRDRDGFHLEGIEAFVQTAVNESERVKN